MLFLLFVALLAADALTLGGWLVPRFASQLRGWAALAGLALASSALVQGLRPPVVSEYTVTLPGLPPERDGLTLVVISDLHLGTLIGEHWLADLVAQVDSLRPDLIAITGDLVDADLASTDPLLPTLQRLRAPLGVWAVLGNHDVYAGADRTTRFAESAGISVLRNRTAQIGTGVNLAGIDDSATFGRTTRADRRLATALASALRRHPIAGTLAGYSDCRCSCGLRDRAHAQRAHPWRPDLAIRGTGAPALPALHGPLPNRGHDTSRRPRCRHLGSTHAPMATGGNPPYPPPLTEMRRT